VQNKKKNDSEKAKNTSGHHAPEDPSPRNDTRVFGFFGNVTRSIKPGHSDTSKNKTQYPIPPGRSPGTVVSHGENLLG